VKLKIRKRTDFGGFQSPEVRGGKILKIKIAKFVYLDFIVKNQIYRMMIKDLVNFFWFVARFG